MKTARFAKVVDQCGPPEVYLPLVEPAGDRILQAAVKAQRVMTVKTEMVGTKADRGHVGFEPGPRRQFLVFPKTLRAFAGRAVVGIKYELLGSADLPKSKRATPPRPPKQAKRKPPKERQKSTTPPPSAKVIAFKPALRRTKMKWSQT